MSRPESQLAWRELNILAERPAERSADLFEADPSRVERFSCEAANLYFDYSKHPVDQKIIDALMALARQMDMGGWIRRLFSEERINSTEDRPALHMALRADTDSAFPDTEFNVMPEVSACLQKMEVFVDEVRSGQWKGYSGKPITDVVNLGIGGSDLGPRLVVKALQPYEDGSGPRIHFVGNGDGAEIHEVLKLLDPETTLFLVVSKSFTTAETLANAELANTWMSAGPTGKLPPQNFVAVTANPELAESMGVGLVLPFWDWVGGRFSVWSAVGVSIALRYGMNAFSELLEGARAMDEHFFHAELSQNMPVIMGLLGVWHTNFKGINQHVVLPYTKYLRWLPPYLQQLEMESNGKGVDREGQPVEYATVPALWGEVGTNAQHAFMQRLHQGPQDVPVDFIVPLKLMHPHQSHHDTLVANCFAQAEALMQGRSAEKIASKQTDGLIQQRVLPGNRPSSMIVMPDLSPYSLGAMLALYEHKVFVQSVIWNINPFDQWGVEEGKRLAGKLIKMIAKAEIGEDSKRDPSTQSLMQRYLASRNQK